MFKFLKKEKNCPMCKMAVSKDGITKYGEKFCSSGCVKGYEKKNQIAGSNNSGKDEGHSCCH